MRRPLLAAFCVLLATAGHADDPVFSGPQVGEPLVSFKIMAVYDASAGEELDPIAEIDGKPSLLVFVHKLTRPGIALTRAITSYAHEQHDKGVMSGIVWLQDDKAKAEEYLTRARKSLNLKVPVGVSVDGGEGPGAYGLNRNVELTILVAKDNKVAANFALVQPSVTEAAKIAGELAKLIDQPAPDQKQMEKFAYPGGQMAARRNMQRKPNQPPQRENPGGELRTKMRKLIASDISESELKEATQEIEDWVGDNRQRQASLARMCSAVIDRGLGGEAAKKIIQGWKEKYQGEK